MAKHYPLVKQELDKYSYDSDVIAEALGTDTCPQCGCKCNNIKPENTYNIQNQKKVYPSCYQYNVLIMLAKRLIKEEQEKELEEENIKVTINPCVSKWRADNRFVVNA